MSAQTSVTRLQKELKKLCTPNGCPPGMLVAPKSVNSIHEWHFLIDGPEGTPYHEGEYLGTLKFPADYPFAPPSVIMNSISGRFEPGKRICLSMSDYHPESWNPAWNIGTILLGLLSFMTSEDQAVGTIGHAGAGKVDTAKVVPVDVRKQTASQTVAANEKDPVCKKILERFLGIKEKDCPIAGDTELKEKVKRRHLNMVT